MDLDPTAVAGRRYSGWFTHNVVLWPRLLLLAANRRFFNRLSKVDQAVFTEAARRATAEPIWVPSPSNVKLPDSVRLVMAHKDDLASLRETVRPVHDELRSTSVGEKTLAYAESFISAHYMAASGQPRT